MISQGVLVAAMAWAAVPTEEQTAAQAIEKALQRHGGDVHRCFEQALADRLDVAGVLAVEVVVGAGGKVKDAKILADKSALPPRLSTCVLASAQRWTVEGLEAGSSVRLPFSFSGQMAQFVVKAADVSDRGPPAPKARGGMRVEPPFRVKILADSINVHAAPLSVTLLTVGPASRVAMHRHPRSAKILHLLKGRARILGPPGSVPQILTEGSSLFLPPGYPHAIENMGRQMPALFLQAFSPPGPERVYRDPTDAKGREDFEVIRDAAQAKDLPGADQKPTFAAAGVGETLSVLGGKAKVRIVFDAKVTGSSAMALDLVEFAPGSVVPRHVHEGAAEAMYILSGGGTLTVGTEDLPFVAESILYIPADQPHAAKFSPADPTVAVQIYTPAGPEQRFGQPLK